MSASAPHNRAEILLLMREIERMQASFARRNVVSWVEGCDQVLDSCRQWIEALEDVED